MDGDASDVYGPKRVGEQARRWASEGLSDVFVFVSLRK
jgi:hypothetical protein